MPEIINMEGTRPPTGASPTQPYKCGQNVKVNTNLFISAKANLFTSAKANLFISAKANLFTSAKANLFTSAKANVVLTLTLTY